MENNHPVDLFSMSLVTAAMAGSCQDGIGRAGKYTPHDGDDDDGDDDDDDDDGDDDDDDEGVIGNSVDGNNLDLHIVYHHRE